LLLSDSLRSSKKLAGFVVFGNGSFDRKIISSLCNRLNGDKNLVSPQIAGGKTGLTNALRTVRKIMDLVKISETNYLIIIDREHLTDLDEVPNQIRQFFNLQVESNMLPQYLKAKISAGTREGLLHIIVMGAKKSIEENLSLLIEKIYGTKIIPNKKNLRAFLRTKKIKIHQLIEEASKEILNIVFPYLMRVLENLDC